MYLDMGFGIILNDKEVLRLWGTMPQFLYYTACVQQKDKKLQRKGTHLLNRHQTFRKEPMNNNMNM